MTTQAEVDGWMSRWARAAKERRKETVKKLLELLPRLEAAHVVRVRVEYSGQGDSGQVDDALYEYADGTPDGLEVSDKLDTEVKNLADQLTPDGYENSEGGQGTVTINVAAKTMTLEHGDYVTDLVHNDPVTYDAAFLES